MRVFVLCMGVSVQCMCGQRDDERERWREWACQFRGNQHTHTGTGRQQIVA